MGDFDRKLSDESKICLLRNLKDAWPSIEMACRVNGSKNPYEDGQDVSNDLYIKYAEKLVEPKNVKIDVDASNNTYMEHEEVKGRAEPQFKPDNQVNVVQGKLISFSLRNLYSGLMTFKLEKLEVKVDKKENEFSHVINKIGPQEILLENTSAKPNPLKVNIYSLQYSIILAAKNRAKDLFSNKNVRNKMHDDFVTDTGEEIQDLNNTSEPAEEKIIEDIDKRRQMKILGDYMKNEMDPRLSQVLDYHLQGVSDREIAKLMDTSYGNARKMLFKARTDEKLLELGKRLKDKN